MNLALAALAVVAGGVASLRWLRVAQREHYLAGTVGRFAARWWAVSSVNRVLAVVGMVAAVVSFLQPWAVLAAAAVVAAGPIGLSLRGTTSPLAWTARLRRVAIAVALLLVVAGVVGWLVHPAWTALAVLALPWLVDLALAVLAPIEERLSSPWVEKAAAALRDSGAKVIAITGSYGKTSTKGYIAQLLGGTKRTVPSPASFNNRMGLARAINEHLSGGVEVFVAEMGTYGPGEIAELTEWIPPDVAVITAIGPVHLERFGTEERIVEAKSEILARAPVAVLNVSDPRLAALADREKKQRRIIRAGTEPGVDVAVVGGDLVVAGKPVGPVPDTAHPGNVACAAGVLVAFGVEVDAERLAALSEPDHRRTVAMGTTGATIIDDTFNSNPAGAEAALDALLAVPGQGRRVVVTPGMVELGGRQFAANRDFAARVAEMVDHLIVVGLTNRKALIEGARGGSAALHVVDNRQEAVEWVRSHLGAGDAVLYENDLPDHYP